MPSHQNWWPMQRPFMQRRYPFLQIRLAADEQTRDKYKNKSTSHSPFSSPVTCLMVPRTAVGLLLVRLVLAVSHAVTSQAVVDAVSVPTLKVVHATTGHVQGCGVKDPWDKSVKLSFVKTCRALSLSLTRACVVLQKLSVSTATAVDPPVGCGQTQVLATSVFRSAGRELTWGRQTLTVTMVSCWTLCSTSVSVRSLICDKNLPELCCGKAS